jgi:hypothetical protein
VIYCCVHCVDYSTSVYIKLAYNNWLNLSVNLKLNCSCDSKLSLLQAKEEEGLILSVNHFTTKEQCKGEITVVILHSVCK